MGTGGLVSSFVFFYSPFPPVLGWDAGPQLAQVSVLLLSCIFIFCL